MNISLSRKCLRIWSRETGSAVPSRVSLFILYTQAESGAYSWDPSRFPRGVHLFILTAYAIGSVPSLWSHAIAYRWSSLPRVRQHRASSPQGSSRNGCCHFAGYHGPINVHLYFPTHPPLVSSGHVESIEKDRTDAGRDDQSCFARSDSQARSRGLENVHLPSLDGHKQDKQPFRLIRNLLFLLLTA